MLFFYLFCCFCGVLFLPSYSWLHVLVSGDSVILCRKQRPKAGTHKHTHINIHARMSLRCARLRLTFLRVFDRRGAYRFDSWINHGSTLSEKCFRGVNNNDIVTAVPPEVVDYQHVGKEIYINSRLDGETERHQNRSGRAERETGWELRVFL